MMRFGLKGLLRRFTLMLSGEVLQSVFHFGLNLALVRALEPEHYGVFAIIFLIGGIALTFVRALAGVPASIFIPRAESRSAVIAYSVTFGSGATILSLVLGLGVAIGLLAWSIFGALAGGAFVTLWCLRSYIRNLLLARRQAAISGWSDLAFTTSGTVLLVLLLLGFKHADLLIGSFLVLTLAHAIGIAVGLILLGEPVRIDLRRHLFRRYAKLWRTLAWSVVGVATANIQGQSQTMLVALFAGPAAYAPIAATLVLFGPLRLPAQALANLIQPEIAFSIARGQTARVWRLIAMATGGLALGCLVYGMLVVCTLSAIETHLFAGRFAGEPMTRISLCVWAVVTTSLLYVGPKVLLETIGAFKVLAAVSLLSAVVGLSVVALLLWWASPTWSLLGVLASEAVVLVCCWRAVGIEARGLAAPRPGGDDARSPVWAGLRSSAVARVAEPEALINVEATIRTGG